MTDDDNDDDDDDDDDDGDDDDDEDDDGGDEDDGDEYDDDDDGDEDDGETMGAVSRSQLMHTIPIINLPVWEGRSHTPLATNPYPSSICHCGKAEATPPLQLNPATHPSNTCNVADAFNQAAKSRSRNTWWCGSGKRSPMRERNSCWVN